MSLNIILALIAVVFAYLIGSVSFSVIFTKIFTGKDVRNEGSGNAGATNVLRTAGKLPGILTFVCDALKGFVACFVGKMVFSYISQTPTATEIFNPMYGAYICLIAVMLGHIFPIFFGFKGGKAVACSVGTFAVCCPIAIVLGLLVFALGVVLTKIVSLSSILATLTVCSVAVLYAFFGPETGGNAFFPAVDYNIIPTIIIAVIAGAIVILKHKSNIVRLLNGTEKKISSKK